MRDNNEHPPKLSREGLVKLIHRYLADDDFDLVWTDHAKERMKQRGIIMSDVRYLLKNDFRLEKTERVMGKNLYKYKVCGFGHRSLYRSICLVIIPSLDKPKVQVITVMWEDMR